MSGFWGPGKQQLGGHGFFGPGGPGAACDPYFASVVLLCHFDDEGSPTTFVDSSSFAQTITVENNAVMDTGLFLFGDGSLECPTTGGVDNGVLIADAPEFDFSVGDWTLEFWIYLPAPGNYSSTLLDKFNFTALYPWQILAQNGLIHVESADAVGATVVSINSLLLTTDAWNHVAYVRNGSDFVLYLNGVGSSPVVYAGTLAQNNFDIFFGAGATGSSETTHLDDLRITNGVARYTADFTIPAEAFPDFAC